MTPLVALIALPVVAPLIGGFGLQTGTFALAGIKETAPVAAMFVFAILFFGVMTDAGLLDPIVGGILRVVGVHPTRIVVGSALLALVAPPRWVGGGDVPGHHAGACCLLYDRLGDGSARARLRRLAGRRCQLPALDRTDAARLGGAADTDGGLFSPLIPVQAVGLAFVFAVAWWLGRREDRRSGRAALDGGGGRRSSRAS